MGSAQGTVANIETALTLADDFVPSLLALIGTLYPPAGAVGSILAKALPTLLTAVHTVAKDTGLSTEDATEIVVQHNTSGQPNAPQLS